MSSDGAAPLTRIGPVICMLMLTSLLLPIVPVAAAHQGGHAWSVAWPKEGSNDTGWMRINATGADFVNGVPAEGGFTIPFAPSALISNLTFEVRVDGQTGVWIDSPVLEAGSGREIVLDASALGGFGHTTEFIDGKSHSGRINQGADVTTGWDIPDGANITHLSVETLRPLDPIVSFSQENFSILATALHPHDGRLFLSVSNFGLISLDRNINPSVVDVADSSDPPTSLLVDSSRSRLLGLAENHSLLSWDLDSGISQPMSVPAANGVDYLHQSANGQIFGLGDGIACKLLISQSGDNWDCSTANWAPTSPVQDTLEHGNILYIATSGDGVLRINLNTGLSQSPWTAQGFLPDNHVNELHLMGDQLLMATEGGGVGRYDLNLAQWLQKWDTNNGLSSNFVRDLSDVPGSVLVLTDTSLHPYDTTLGSFNPGLLLNTAGLSRGSDSLIEWPAIGSRAPANDAILATDGSGRLVEFLSSSPTQVHATLLLGTSPTGEVMGPIAESGNLIFTASGQTLDRFDQSIQRWLPSVDVGSPITDIAIMPATSGSAALPPRVYLGTENGLRQIDATSAPSPPIVTFTTSDGLLDNMVDHIVTDPISGHVAIAHINEGLSVFSSYNSVVVRTHTMNPRTSPQTPNFDDLSSDEITDLAIHDGVVHIGTLDDGVLRMVVGNGTWKSPWGSLGVDKSDIMPTSSDGTVLYTGIFNYGVLRYDLAASEFLSPWEFSGGGGNVPGGGSNSPDQQVSSIDALSSGTIVVGTYSAIWVTTNAGQSWSRFNGIGRNGLATFDLDHDSNYIYAGTNNGVCRFDRSTSPPTLDECWDQGDGLASDYAYSVRVQGSKLLVGLEGGAAVLDIASGTILQTWEKEGGASNAIAVEVNGVVYLALRYEGIERYDLATSSWLSGWSSQNTPGIASDDIQAMIVSDTPNHIWIGGSFGVIQLNLANASQTYYWKAGSQNPTVRSNAVSHLVEHSGVLHLAYSQDDIIDRIIISNATSLAGLDTGSLLGQQWMVTRHMGQAGDDLIIGAQEWWTGGLEGGGIVRYNMVTRQVTEAILGSGSIDNVMIEELSGGDVLIAYAGHGYRRVSSSGSIISEWGESQNRSIDVSDIAVVGNVAYVSTSVGVMRYDSVNDTWLSPWDSSNGGLPSSVSDNILSIEEINGDLWIGTPREGWWQPEYISQLDFSAGSWNTWRPGQNNLPSGDPVDFVECGGLVNVALQSNRGFGGGGQQGQGGGIGFIDAATQSVSGQLNPSSTSQRYPSSLACDDQNVLYIGYSSQGTSSPGQGLRRYDHGNSTALPALKEGEGVSSDAVSYRSMTWDNGWLIAGHSLVGAKGGISAIKVRGSSGMGSNGSYTELGIAVTDPGHMGNTWWVGRPGGLAGLSSVESWAGKYLTAVVDQYLYLPTGYITGVSGNSTHIYILSGWVGSQQGVIEGIYQSGGGISWKRGWNPGTLSDPDDIFLHDGTLFVSTEGDGLWSINLTKGTNSAIPGTLHKEGGSLSLAGDHLVLGLRGSPSTNAGVQVWNTTTNNWVGGDILPGLPGSMVFDMAIDNGLVLFATNGGIGVWNDTTSEWQSALTVGSGLISNVVYGLDFVGTDLWVSSDVGLMRLSFPGFGVLSTHGVSSGLLENRMVFTHKLIDPSGTTILAISHPGVSGRPGVSLFNPSTRLVVDTVQPDPLPSNTIVALSGDSWGVHIACDSAPLVHWSSTNGAFEFGATPFTLGGWPIIGLASDGIYLGVLLPTDTVIISVVNPQHNVIGKTGISSRGGVFSGRTVMTTSDDGLHRFSITPSVVELPRIVARRATPLSAMAFGQRVDVTLQSHIGMSSEVINPSFPINSMSNSSRLIDAGGISYETIPFALTSPIDGSATWARTVSLNYSGTWDLAALDPTLEGRLQYQIDTAPLVGSRMLNFELSSPLNGSIEVRATFDWIRTEPPAIILRAWDRPADGGGAVEAEWALSSEAAEFGSYNLYLEQGPVAEFFNLDDRTPDFTLSKWDHNSTLMGTSPILTANGAPITDGDTTWMILRIASIDGTLGTPSPVFGPFTTSDEIPSAPEWANASVPDDVLRWGELDLEWGECIGHDIEYTRIRSSNAPILDSLGLKIERDVAQNRGNKSTLVLDHLIGMPTWFALTCVDFSGQEDVSNATVIGPFVPRDQPPDIIPPDRLENLQARDTPNDDGGSITVSWDRSSTDDCAYIVIGAIPSSELEIGTTPTSTDLLVAQIISDCGSEMVQLIRIGDSPLMDGTLYWIGAWAVDQSGNAGDTLIVNATPIDNLGGLAMIPDRIEVIEIWDVANDTGNALRIEWEPTDDPYFWYYVVWISTHPTDNVFPLFSSKGLDPRYCGCYVVRNRDPLTEESLMGISVTEALSGGTGPTTASVRDIVPGVTYYASVTVHDVQEDVHLNGLAIASGEAIDNIKDKTPPQPLSTPEVEDRPRDHGTAIQFRFSESNAPDLAGYLVFADIEPITDASLLEPVVSLGRDAASSWHEISTYSDGSKINKTFVHVAVVPFDHSNNEQRNGLSSAGAQAVDDTTTLPTAQSISISWSTLDDILIVEWISSKPIIDGNWHIVISNTSFTQFNSSMVIFERPISPALLTGIDPLQDHYLGIHYVAEDGFNNTLFDSILVPARPITEADGVVNGTGRGVASILPSGVGIAPLLSTLAALFSLIALVMVLRGRRKRRDDMWMDPAVWRDVDPSSEDLWSDQGVSSSVNYSQDSAPTIGVQQQPLTQIQDQAYNEIYSPQISSDPYGQSSSDLDMGFLDDLL